MSRVMFGDLRIGSVRSGLWARRGHAMAVHLHERSPKMSGQQDSRAPHAHRRRYMPQRDESMRNSVEFAVTSAHAGAWRLGLKTRGVLITSARSPKWAGIEVTRQTVCLWVTATTEGVFHARRGRSHRAAVGMGGECSRRPAETASRVRRVAGDGAAFGRSRARLVGLPTACTGTRKELRPPDVPFALRGSSSVFRP
jgi:hypothetical protein